MESKHQFDAGDRSPRVPDDRRIYAVGDIHGRIDLLNELHALIVADAETAQNLRRTVVYLGDYVDRGPGTFDVLDVLINEPLAGFERVHLMGNHEDMMLKFLAGPEIGGGNFLSDTSPEEKAAELRALPDVHYRDAESNP